MLEDKLAMDIVDRNESILDGCSAIMFDTDGCLLVGGVRERKELGDRQRSATVDKEADGRTVGIIVDIPSFEC